MARGGEQQPDVHQKEKFRGLLPVPCQATQMPLLGRLVTGSRIAIGAVAHVRAGAGTRTAGQLAAPRGREGSAVVAEVGTWYVVGPAGLESKG